MPVDDAGNSFVGDELIYGVRLNGTERRFYFVTPITIDPRDPSTGILTECVDGITGVRISRQKRDFVSPLKWQEIDGQDFPGFEQLKQPKSGS
jgi:hypothetical protein